MSTYWLSFNDHDFGFLGVTIVDAEKDIEPEELMAKVEDLGLYPGGCVFVQRIEARIPERYKDRLITDEALLVRLGSTGRVGTGH
jgi:hypothetical protein